ncbi:hypothetical protein B0F90DRAFT_1758194, partial [Multifurca ochricompacta]
SFARPSFSRATSGRLGTCTGNVAHLTATITFRARACATSAETATSRLRGGRLKGRRITYDMTFPPTAIARFCLLLHCTIARYVAFRAAYTIRGEGEGGKKEKGVLPSRCTSLWAVRSLVSDSTTVETSTSTSHDYFNNGLGIFFFLFKKTRFLSSDCYKVKFGQ